MEKGLDIHTEAQQIKAKKARRKLIRIVVILLIVAAAAVCVVIITSAMQPATATNIDKPITPDETTDAKVETKATTSVPALASLFGKTTDQAIAQLGSKAKLDSTADGTDSAVASVTKVATVSIAPDSGDSSSSKLYLSLDASGLIVKVNYMTSLSSLGNSDLLFEDILADRDFMKETLTSAGVTLPSDYKLATPDKSAYQTTTTGSNGTQTVTKEAYTFTGSTGLSSAPANWSIAYSFDHTLGSSANITANDEAARTMFLTFW